MKSKMQLEEGFEFDDMVTKWISRLKDHWWITTLAAILLGIIAKLIWQSSCYHIWWSSNFMMIVFFQKSESDKSSCSCRRSCLQWCSFRSSQCSHHPPVFAPPSPPVLLLDRFGNLFRWFEVVVTSIAGFARPGNIPASLLRGLPPKPLHLARLLSSSYLVGCLHLLLLLHLFSDLVLGYFPHFHAPFWSSAMQAVCVQLLNWVDLLPLMFGSPLLQFSVL